MTEENTPTDYNTFKEDLLKEIRLSENRLLKKIKEQSQEITRLNNEQTSKFESISTKNKEILDSFVDQKMKLEKMDEFEVFKNKIDDMIITHEIRINNSIEEISQMKLKYDKIFTDNLTISGYVGPACQYKSIGEYIYANINDMNKIKRENELIRKDLKEIKARMDSLMATTLSLVNGTVKRCNEYCNECLRDLNQDITNNLNKIYGKIDKLKMLENLINNNKEESETKIAVLNKDIDDFDYKMKKMQTDYINLLEEKSKIFIPQIDEINKNIGSFSDNLEVLKTSVQKCDLKTTNFDNLIKDIRAKYVKIFNDFYLNNKLLNLLNSPLLDRKNIHEEKNFKICFNNNNSFDNSSRSLEYIKPPEIIKTNEKRYDSVKKRNKEKSKQKIIIRNNFLDSITGKDKEFINEDYDNSQIATERVRMKYQILDQTNERNKEKEIEMKKEKEEGEEKEIEKENVREKEIENEIEKEIEKKKEVEKEIEKENIRKKEKGKEIRKGNEKEIEKEIEKKKEGEKEKRIEKEKEKKLLSIDQNPKSNKAKSNNLENKKNDPEINIFNKKLKNISSKSSSQKIKKKHDRNSNHNILYIKNTVFLNNNKKDLYTFNTTKGKEKIIEIPYLTNNNNSNSIFTSSSNNNNTYNKVNINENKLNKIKSQTDKKTAKSVKLLNRNRNDCGIDGYTGNNLHTQNTQNQININQEIGSIYKLTSFGFGPDFHSGIIETYNLAAKHSNNKRSVDLGSAKPLNSMKFTGFKFHRINSNERLNTEIPYKIGSAFGTTVYNEYDKKEEKYKNLSMINKNIKMNKTTTSENQLNISLATVAKVKFST